jgi:hypothetical protein
MDCLISASRSTLKHTSKSDAYHVYDEHRARYSCEGGTSSLTIEADDQNRATLAAAVTSLYLRDVITGLAFAQCDLLILTQA